MLVMKEESFGPIIGIMKVENDEEAIQLMQDTEYGLTASVYSTDKQTAENILAASIQVPDTGTAATGFLLPYPGVAENIPDSAWHYPMPDCNLLYVPGHGICGEKSEKLSANYNLYIV